MGTKQLNYQPQPKPVKGGWAAQIENNNKYFAKLLTEAGIAYTANTAYALELWGEPDVLLEIKKGDEAIYVGFDRDGYGIDGLDSEDFYSADGALQAVKEWLNENN